jgi:hypothetical protein
MPEFTVVASAVRALMELAVSKGACRGALAERSRVDPAELQDCDNRIPFSKYVALMRAGQELCHDPALALHFGESVDMSEISFVCQIGAASANWAENLAQMNRYGRLTIDVDGVGSGDRFVLARTGGQFWMIDTRENANDFPELTESTFARIACSCRRWLGENPFLKAAHFTHAAPAYRAEYDRIFRIPVVFESDRNALLADDALLTCRPPSASRHVSEILSARGSAAREAGELEVHQGPGREPVDARLAQRRCEHGHDRQPARRQPADPFPQAESGGRDFRGTGSSPRTHISRCVSPA